MKKAVAYGLQIISASLKAQGHSVQMVFLCDLSDPAQPYSADILKDMKRLCRDSDLIGFSVMTNHFVKAADLTLRLKKDLKTPIIWGGIHATVEPEECLEYADLICIGEGEEAMLDLVDALPSGSISNIPNIGFRQDNRIICNAPRPLTDNLGEYPFPDYDIEAHYALENGRIVPMTNQLLEDLTPEYNVITTRNCPHSCSFCANNALRRIYGTNENFVRKRPITNVIEELVDMKERLPFISQILIADDTFFFRSIEEIQDFCTRYREQVGLPMRCYVSPLTLEEEKLIPMIDAGLNSIGVGIQSFSEETLSEIYQRNTPQTAIRETVRIIEKYRDHWTKPPQYHILVDNPYETDESKAETIRFIASLPAGSDVHVLSLTFFPGTDIHERATADNLIDDQFKEIYNKKIKNIQTGADGKSDYLTCITHLLCMFPSMDQEFKARLCEFLLDKKTMAHFRKFMR